jgi:DNA repair photolyase
MVNSSHCYTTPFALTSQFCFCALPLRLDTYRGCSFRCTYCFARYRGGNSPDSTVYAADPRSVETTFRRALTQGKTKSTVVGQFIRRRVPVHFGGMSDPLQPAELRFQSTEKILQILGTYQYPTVLSTRSMLVVQEPYLSLLRDIQPLVVQLSFSTTDDRVAGALEPRCHPPSSLLRAGEMLAKHGINVTCRWQPFVPGVSEAPDEFIRRVASIGCKHVALEHLKLPLERRNPLWRELTKAVGRDLHAEYMRYGGLRDGREYVLPPEEKLDRVLQVGQLTRRAGMTFGAADNEFQYLSDNFACCSGVDQFPGFQNFFRHQVGYAVRKSRGAERISYDVIRHEWQPNGSIDRYLNSKTRIGNRGTNQGTLKQHVLARWNDPSASGSPASFFGISVAAGWTGRHPVEYEWKSESKSLSEQTA